MKKIHIHLSGDAAACGRAHNGNKDLADFDAYWDTKAQEPHYPWWHPRKHERVAEADLCGGCRSILARVGRPGSK